MNGSIKLLDGTLVEFFHDERTKALGAPLAGIAAAGLLRSGKPEPKRRTARTISDSVVRW